MKRLNYALITALIKVGKSVRIQKIVLSVEIEPEL